jgi:citrate lyase subunit beta/citryl-CoA lyase
MERVNFVLACLTRRSAPDAPEPSEGHALRSLLYVPAHAERFTAKAHERDADAVILDLEDAVPLTEKANARAALPKAVPLAGSKGAKVFVRVNATPSLDLDDAEAACRAGAFGLFVPKVNDPEVLRHLSDHLSVIEAEMDRAPLRFIPLIEDPGAVLDARAIATATPRVYALILGGEDIATALGGEPTPEVLHLPKLLVHLAAKAAGVKSFGLLRSVADYKDTAAIEAAAKTARSFGFDGASCVHPALVPILNKAFGATPEEIDHARRMVVAFEQAAAKGLGAFEFDGKMVDLPVVQRARTLLERAEGSA